MINSLTEIAPLAMYYVSPFDGEDVTPPAEPPAEEPKVFTPEEVNSLLEKERQALKKKNDEVIKTLEAFKKQNTMTSKEREALETQIEVLQDQWKTKEELAKKEAAKKEKLYNEKLTNLQSEHENLLKKYENETIERSIIDAATMPGVDACDPSVISKLLRQDTRMVEVFDDEGTSLGKHPRVKIKSTSEDGKPITLELTPAEAVKHLKESNETDFLFRGAGAGGAGRSNSGRGKASTLADLAKSGDARAYIKARLGK